MSPRRRILCTEDNADTRELITLILSGQGYEVTCGDSPAHSLALAKSQSFDLYLMDTWLPGLSGVELTKQLREFDATTPVLFYSGAGFESDKEAARAAGAQGYLVKPVLHQDLITEVRRLIEASHWAARLGDVAETGYCGGGAQSNSLGGHAPGDLPTS